jgi:hypothetical protein
VTPVRALAAALAGVLVCAACDSIHVESASREVPATLEAVCVLEALRAERDVRDVGDAGLEQLWFSLEVPEDVCVSRSGEEPPPACVTINVDIDQGRDGSSELQLRMVKVGAPYALVYTTYVRTTLEDLRDRVLEKCAGRWTRR